MTDEAVKDPGFSVIALVLATVIATILRMLDIITFSG